MARGDPLPRGALSGLLNWAQSEGMSQRATLRYIRAAGLGVRNSVLGGVWREVASARQNAPALADLGGREVVPDALHTDRPGANYDGYTYTLRVGLRDTTTGDISTMFYSVAGDDPMTVDEIMSQAEDELIAGLETDSGEGQELLGSVLVGARHYSR